MVRQDKKEVERKKMEEHKQKLADAKAKRRAGGDLERPAPALEEKPSILIYCEGRNTEPSYFNKFKVSSAIVKAFGEGKNTLSLVEAARKIVDNAFNKGYAFDQVWCVFDADPKPDNPKQLENFNDAIALAKKYNFNCAYSNQAFEYWLILHFEDHQGGAMPRTDYDTKLNFYLKSYGISYDGNGSKMITPEIFGVLFEQLAVDRSGKPITRYDKAEARAERNYDNIGDHTNPGSEESSTLVHKLVKELIKYA
jgi:hypothetical protein